MTAHAFRLTTQLEVRAFALPRYSAGHMTAAIPATPTERDSIGDSPKLNHGRSGRGSGVIFDTVAQIRLSALPNSLYRAGADYSSPSTPVVRMVARPLPEN